MGDYHGCTGCLRTARSDKLHPTTQYIGHKPDHECATGFSRQLPGQRFERRKHRVPNRNTQSLQPLAGLPNTIRHHPQPSRIRGVALEDEYELNSAIASQGEGIIRFADDIYHATVSFQYLIKEAGVSPQLTFIIRTQNEDGGVSSLTKSITTPAIPEPEPEPPTELDLWIDSTFCYPYNIKVTYKQQAGTEEYDEETLPPHEDLVQPFLKAVLKIWGKPYMETSGKGNEFLQEYAFRELKLVGNGGRYLSAYSMASSLEDFSEILSHYICRTPAEWEELLAPLNVPEGHEKHDQYEESKRKINEKQQVVSLYMQNAWNINIDDLRAAVTQGIDEAANGNLD